MIAYRINDQILLAGQPQPEDWQPLVQEGYRMVINMRSDPNRASQEGHNAEEAGLSYLHLPLPTYEIETEHIKDFHQAVTHAGNDKVIIHCRTASRVALLWMLNRMVYEGWTQEQAEAELRAAGYGEDSMETFTFCTEDYFERLAETQTENVNT